MDRYRVRTGIGNGYSVPDYTYSRKRDAMSAASRWVKGIGSEGYAYVVDTRVESDALNHETGYPVDTVVVWTKGRRVF